MPRARQDLERMRQAARERHPSTLRTLCHRLAQLGDFAEAARAQRELVAMSVGAWDTAGAWRKLAELERRAEDYPAAWTALRECQRVLSHTYPAGRSVAWAGTTSKSCSSSPVRRTLSDHAGR